MEPPSLNCVCWCCVPHKPVPNSLSSLSRRLLPFSRPLPLILCCLLALSASACRRPLNYTVAVLTLGTVLGPIVLGTNLNYLLFGIVIYQFASYLSHSSAQLALSRHNPYALHSFHFKPDPWPVRVVVYALMALDTYHTAVCGYMQWQYTINHFGDPGILQLATWPYASTPIVTVIASVTVQCFLAWRIRIITNRNVWFALIVTLSIIQGLAGLGTGIGALWLSDISLFYQLEPIAGVWFCTQVACDLLITTTLILTLNKERTGFKYTDSTINRLIRVAVETAAFATIFCVLDMTMFFAESGNNLHLAFALPMGRIYSNTLLATLNSRGTQRELLASPDPGWPGAGRRGWAEFRRGVADLGVFSPGEDKMGEGIKVSVTHDIELSPCAPSSPSVGSSTLVPSPLPSPSKPNTPSLLANTLPSAPPMRSILALPLSPASESPASPRSGELSDLEEDDEGEDGRKSRFSESVYSFCDVDLSDVPGEGKAELGTGLGRGAGVATEELVLERRARAERTSERLEREIVRTLQRMPSGKL
ncbi:hypothetical protein CALVIDRAFT_523162 [Calocera viscosa TUFC12733]|uniref:DUF6534 domain-containing protein n=1 Tax=Calocera viscosa (strain TUFC12733) TaxID=1330018 RepID=A0A167G3G2_CALVF|nr:hypothetical protein CALVIDRAFT_523162 [Calocera viscosa TUFC12733]